MYFSVSLNNVQILVGLKNKKLDFDKKKCYLYFVISLRKNANNASNYSAPLPEMV